VPLGQGQNRRPETPFRLKDIWAIRVRLQLVVRRRELEIKVAEKILAAMVRADPSEKDDPGFADVIKFITVQLNEGNVKD
jgi:hypothetical protein